jgi:hypothetical protein
MSVFLFTYDLVNEKNGRDYKPLYAELKRLGAHRCMLSVWLLNVDNTASQLRDYFQTLIDADDRLFITKLRKGEHGRVMNYSGTADWLLANPPE